MPNPPNEVMMLEKLVIASPHLLLLRNSIGDSFVHKKEKGRDLNLSPDLSHYSTP